MLQLAIRLRVPFVLVVLGCCVGGCVGCCLACSAQRPAAVQRATAGFAVYTPSQPGPSRDETPGTHRKETEDRWGDHILSTTTIPPMTRVSLPAGRVSIDDPTLGISAGSIDRPAGWKFEGSIHRDISCSFGDPEPAFRLTSPDGIVLEMLTPFFTRPTGIPQDSWSSSGCGINAPGKLSAAEILTRYLVPSLQPGATIVGQPEPTPGTEEWVRQTTKSVEGGSMTGEDMRIRLAFQREGQPAEAWIGARTIFFHGASGWESSISTVFRVIAPPGRLDDAIKIGNSLHFEMNPVWEKQEQHRQDVLAKAMKRGSLARPNPDVGRPSRPVDPGYHLGDYSNYIGDNPKPSPTVYKWRNAATGQDQTTDHNVSPGPGWTAIP